MAITLKHGLLWSVAIALAVATACKDDDDDDDRGEGGAAGEAGALTGGTGGGGGTGARTGGGTAGEETGGGTGGTTGGSAGEAGGGTGGAAGGAGTAGQAGAAGAMAFWAEAYDPTGLPDVEQPSPTHGVGEECADCHDGSTAPAFLFGGTVYESDGTTGAPNVQVGVMVGTTVYTTYSAENGNFWVTGDEPLDGQADDARLRTADGELMRENHGGASCNQCHDGGLALTVPEP